MGNIFFRHDAHAKDDEKIVLLCVKYQDSGYAYYFKLLEIMCEDDEHIIHHSKCSAYAYRLHVQMDVLLDFLSYCTEVGLFVKDKRGYCSQRFKDEMDKIDKQRAERSERAKAQHKGVKESPAPAEVKPVKVKPVKVKPTVKEYLIADNLSEQGKELYQYIKDNRISEARTINLTETEINRYCSEFDMVFMCAVIDRLYQYYNKPKPKVYASDSRAIRSWVLNAVMESGVLPVPSAEHSRIKSNVFLRQDDYKALLIDCINEEELNQFITQYSENKKRYKDLSNDVDADNLVDFIAKKKVCK